MLRILHVEDNTHDAVFVERALRKARVDAEFTLVRSGEELNSALERDGFDLVLCDSAMPGFSGRAALEAVRVRDPQLPFIIVSGSIDERSVREVLEAGASDFVSKDHLWQLPLAVKRVCGAAASGPAENTGRHSRGTLRLVAAVQELSLARSLEQIMAVVRRAAREMTGADGATFVLRDGDYCHYADENAIGPLWKGKRFPLETCISGWAMMNAKPAVIGDIYSDPRIPVDAYRPTFVKSLVMVPIRSEAPLGAIGNYWARPYLATEEEVEMLQALANVTAVAMENVQIHAELEQRVQLRTRELEIANRDLESFSYSVSHDLRAPVRAINGYLSLLTEDCEEVLDERAWGYVANIKGETARMKALIEDLIRLGRLSRAPLKIEMVDLSTMAREIVGEYRDSVSGREIALDIAPSLNVQGDSGLLRVMLENLLSNAWKYTSNRPQPEIAFGRLSAEEGEQTFFVRDNGVGFDMQHAEKLFRPFQRLHGEEFSGTGVGLATVLRIVERHGGRIWASAEVGQGATFYFSLPHAPGLE